MRVRAQFDARVEDGFEIAGQTVTDGAVFEREAETSLAHIVGVEGGRGGGGGAMVEGPGREDVGG